MADGQASEAPATLDDIAAFLVDNPRADSPTERDNPKEPVARRSAPADNSEEKKQETADESPADGRPDDDSPIDPDASPPPPGDDDENDENDEEEETAKSRTSGLKFKVPVKGEDGAESTIEVDEKELVAGYQRHADYTRKTQELGTREREAVQLVEKRLSEGQTYYIEQAHLAMRAIQTLAGLKSDAELADMSVSNPALYVQETERARQIGSILDQLRRGIEDEKKEIEKKAEAWNKQEKARAWGVLGPKGISEEKLIRIFNGVHDAYGIPKEKLARVQDPALVLIFKDVLELREIKAKTKSVQQKVQEAPKLPAPRQATPRQERVNASLDRKFKTGRASTKDLASFLVTNRL